MRCEIITAMKFISSFRRCQVACVMLHQHPVGTCINGSVAALWLCLRRHYLRLLRKKWKFSQTEFTSCFVLSSNGWHHFTIVWIFWNNFGCWFGWGTLKNPSIKRMRLPRENDSWHWAGQVFRVCQPKALLLDTRCTLQKWRVDDFDDVDSSLTRGFSSVLAFGLSMFSRPIFWMRKKSLKSGIQLLSYCSSEQMWEISMNKFSEGKLACVWKYIACLFSSPPIC